MSIDEILEQFKDGERRYREDPIFHSIIHCLERDDNPIRLLDQVLSINENVTKQYHKLIEEKLRGL
jgi:hypothetical protein